MFGYVTPVKSELRQQDFVLFRAFYCGVCCTTGKNYGSLPRFTVNYDIAFFGALAHDLMRRDVTFAERRCAGNPFRKKLVIEGNDLLERVCAANILLMYYKLCDDVIDGGGPVKRMARAALGRAYKKAKDVLPGADGLMAECYENLRKLEKAGETSLDKTAHCFASLLRGTFDEVTGHSTSDDALSLCYNIGKFVYFADALDDIDEDVKSGNYNPFLASAGGEYKGRRAFFEEHADEIGFALHSTVNSAVAAFNRLDFEQSYSLLENIVYKGLRAKVKELLESEKKLPAPKI